MAKLQLGLSIYLLLHVISDLKACNPGQNVTSSETSRPRPISNLSSQHSSEELLTVADTVTLPFSEQFSANCHNDDEQANGSDLPVYQHITVSGMPFQRGESHGRQAQEKILKLISFYKSSSLMPAWTDCINFVRTNYVEALHQYYPNGLEEMKGIAEGAGVQLEDILILNSRYDLIRWKKSERIRNHAGYPEKKARYSSELPECSKENLWDSTAATPTETEFTTTNAIYDDDNNISDIGVDECTGAVALSSSTKYAHVLIGQNWDTNEFLLKNDTAILLEVYPDPCENIKPFVMLTEAGQLGSIGMNSEGLGVVAMSLGSSVDTFQRSNGKGWIPSSLLKRMFIESPNFSMGLRAILQTPIHVSINMIIATADDEAINIELTPNSYFIMKVPLEKEVIAHSNHFKSVSFTAQNDIKDGSRGGSSLYRDRRVEKHLLSAWPRISEETFQTAFKDHVGYPNAVCSHSLSKEKAWTSTSPGKMTVASVILNLSERTLQIAKGPPCTVAYKNYCFKFSQL